MTVIRLLTIELKNFKENLTQQEVSLQSETDSFFVRLLRKRIRENKHIIAEIEYAINLLKEDRKRLDFGWEKLRNSGLDKEIKIEL